MRDLQAIEARLDRAQVHHDSFNSLVGQTLGGFQTAVRRETNDDGSKHTYYAVIPEGLVETLSLFASDCLHNLRAALDNTIYRLAELHTRTLGQEVPDNVAESLAFPICTSSKFFRQQVDRGRLRCLKANEIHIVEAHQPYKRWDPPEDSPLWMLRQFQDIDKHRFLLRFSFGRDAYMTHTPYEGFHIRWKIITKWEERVDNDTPLIEFTVQPPNRDLDLEYDPRLLVFLNDGEAGQQIRIMRSAVREFVVAMKELS